MPALNALEAAQRVDVRFPEGQLNGIPRIHVYSNGAGRRPALNGAPCSIGPNPGGRRMAGSCCGRTPGFGGIGRDFSRNPRQSCFKPWRGCRVQFLHCAAQCLATQQASGHRVKLRIGCILIHHRTLLSCERTTGLALDRRTLCSVARPIADSGLLPPLARHRLRGDQSANRPTRCDATRAAPPSWGR